MQLSPRATAHSGRDKRRQNALVRGGWKVLRYTPRDLRLRPDAVVEEIRCVLASAA